MLGSIPELSYYKERTYDLDTGRGVDKWHYTYNVEINRSEANTTPISLKDGETITEHSIKWKEDRTTEPRRTIAEPSDGSKSRSAESQSNAESPPYNEYNNNSNSNRTIDKGAECSDAPTYDNSGVTPLTPAKGSLVPRQHEKVEELPIQENQTHNKDIGTEPLMEPLKSYGSNKGNGSKNFAPPHLNQSEPFDVQVDSVIKIIAQNQEALKSADSTDFIRDVENFIRWNIDEYLVFSGPIRDIDPIYFKAVITAAVQLIVTGAHDLFDDSEQQNIKKTEKVNTAARKIIKDYLDKKIKKRGSLNFTEWLYREIRAKTKEDADFINTTICNLNGVDNFFSVDLERAKALSIGGDD